MYGLECRAINQSTARDFFSCILKLQQLPHTSFNSKKTYVTPVMCYVNTAAVHLMTRLMQLINQQNTVTYGQTLTAHFNCTSCDYYGVIITTVSPQPVLLHACVHGIFC